MNGVDVALAALGAVVAVIIVRDLLIWSLFYRRGWRIMCPPAQKAGDTKNSAEAAAGDPPAASAGPKPSIREVA